VIAALEQRSAEVPISKGLKDVLAMNSLIASDYQ
jgi:hypothetical protein